MPLIGLIAAAAFGAAAAPAEPALVSAGERVFQRCYACHSVDPGEKGLPGPNLAGVVGRRAGAERGFDYSPAMRAAADRGLVWREATLDRFAADPEAVVPKTSMSFVGLRDAADRQALIAYLKAHGRP